MAILSDHGLDGHNGFDADSENGVNGGFDAKSVIQETLTFGQSGDEVSLLFCYNSNSFDHNGDGLIDLKCKFKISLTGFQLGDEEGILKGMTMDGMAVIGHDAVFIVK